MRQIIAIGILGLLADVGCIAKSPQPFTPVADNVVRQTGLPVSRPPRRLSDIAPPTEWLQEPLRVDSAVRIALAYNRRLAAAYDELDISQADLLQAGLLKNPVLDLSVRLPDRAPRKTYLDFGISDSFVDLLLVGVRKRLAAAELSRHQALTANEILKVISAVRSAYFAAQAAEQIRQLRQTIVDAALAADTAAEQIRKAGNMAAIEPLRTHGSLLRARAEFIAAESQAAQTHQTLSALMGVVDTQTPWTLADHLPDVGTQRPAANLDQQASARRQDLLAARQSVTTAAQRLGVMVNTRFWADATIGPEAERETEGQWRIGPTLSLPIPLFDQGQAAVAHGQAAMQLAADDYHALLIDVFAQVHTATAKLDASRAVALLYRDEILPNQQQVLDQTQRRYNGMYDSVFVLLEAKQTQIDNAIHYVEALRDYWSAEAELDAAVGGRLPASPTLPASLPTTRSSKQGMNMDRMDMENMDMHMEH